jgi:hypothetical protein
VKKFTTPTEECQLGGWPGQTVTATERENTARSISQGINPRLLAFPCTAGNYAIRYVGRECGALRVSVSVNDAKNLN